MMRKREVRQTRRTARFGALAAAFGAVLLGGLLSAAPARADGNFERGFETELGRILAHETVHFGKHVLLAGTPRYAVHDVHTLRVVHRPSVHPPTRVHFSRSEHRHAHLHRRHDRHHRHDAGCRRR